MNGRDGLRETLACGWDDPRSRILGAAVAAWDRSELATSVVLQMEDSLCAVVGVSADKPLV